LAMVLFREPAVSCWQIEGKDPSTSRMTVPMPQVCWQLEGTPLPQLADSIQDVQAVHVSQSFPAGLGWHVVQWKATHQLMLLAPV
jgi:hypothetical protein